MKRTDGRNRMLAACCAFLCGVTLLLAVRYERERREAETVRHELATERALNRDLNEAAHLRMEALPERTGDRDRPNAEAVETEEPYIRVATVPFGEGLEPALNALKQKGIDAEGDGTGDAYAIRVRRSDAEAARRLLKQVAAEYGCEINF